VRRNLQLIQGKDQGIAQELDVAGSFVSFARELTQALAPERFPAAKREYVVRGRKNALNVLGGGAIILTAHVGPWDAAAAAFRRVTKKPVLMLMAQESDATASRIQDEIRRSHSVEVLRLGASPLSGLPALEHLESGGVVVAQMDRIPAGGQPLCGRMFGAPYCLPRGIFRLAAIAGVPILIVLSARLQGQRQRIEIGPPVRLSKRPNEAELQRAAQDVLDRLERHLAAFPRQWYHFSSVPQP
jgi:lauroyl/myristoyl acyltransferase